MFAVPGIQHLFDVKIFMDVDSDTSLLRRVRRDIVHRRRDVEGVLTQYERYVKPAYEKLVAPHRNNAHICVIGGAYNEQGYEMICSYIEKKKQK